MNQSYGYRVVTAPRAGCQLLDLHNHSEWSYDSSNTLADYERAHRDGRFHVLAITDHNAIAGALHFRDRADFPVIVGEEIDTCDGEIVGLFLEHHIAEGASVVATAQEIRAQGGLVYLQHPFFRWIRRDLSLKAIAELAQLNLIDVVEGLNGGPLMRWSNLTARDWATRHRLPCGAGSDAHHPKDIGTCVVEVPHDTLDLSRSLNASDLVAALKRGDLVNRSRPSVSTLASRVAYAGRHGTAVYLKRIPRKRRIPDQPSGSTP